MKYKNKLPKQEEAYFFNFNLHHWNLSWKAECLFLFFFLNQLLLFFNFLWSHMTNLVWEDTKWDLYFTLEDQVMEEFSSTLYSDPSSNSGSSSCVLLVLFNWVQVRFRFNIGNSSVPLYFGIITQELPTTHMPHGVGLASWGIWKEILGVWRKY